MGNQLAQALKRAALVDEIPTTPALDDELQQQLRGEMNEHRVADLLTTHPDRPSWIVSAFKTETELDNLGVDVVVRTIDLGALPVQVKSNRKDASEFRRKKLSIAVAIVHAGLDDESALLRVVNALIKLRTARHAQSPWTHGIHLVAWPSIGGIVRCQRCEMLVRMQPGPDGKTVREYCVEGTGGVLI